MQAVVSLNGKQYSVEEGRYISVDLLPNAENETITIDNVLMIIDGESSLLGAPFIEGASATAKVLSHGRGPKVLVYKMRCKKGYRRKNGHRQGFTKLQIESLAFPGKKASASPAKAEPKAKPAKAEAADSEPKAPKKPAAKKAVAEEAKAEE
ncbi:MAG: 50S ribosomal protein L21 [Vampirovibrionales bacterium]|nr:50S ribosomal protein L21 [Vampirovibrionales bacterium]